MNPTQPLRIRVLLGGALTLSLVAVSSVLLKPSPVPLPTSATSTTGGVKIEAHSSHPLVGANGTEFFHEYTVTLVDDAKPVEHVSIAVVLDRSGSMTGSKLDDARRAVNRLVDLLRDGDQLSVVTFGSDVTGGTLRTIDVETRALFHTEVNAVVAVGGTNVSEGLIAGQRSLQSATGAKRLILVSDGQPTEGVSDQLGLTRFVGGIHDAHVTVSALGVGVDYDGPLLTALSERGGGMVGHLQNAAALEEVLGKELDAARTATARNVELHLTLENAEWVDAPGRQVTMASMRNPVIHLADLRPNTPTRVLARFRSSGGGHAAHSGAVAQLSWARVSGESMSSELALFAGVTDDLDEVRTLRDEPVFARGVSAMGQLRILAAASAYERGDDRAGQGLLDEARGLFGMSADSLAGQTEVENVRSRASKGTALERKSLNYEMQKKSLSNFGRENEGY